MQPGAPVEVRVDSSAMGSFNGFASMDVEVQFLEGVLMPTYGTGCRIWNGSRFELTGRYVEQAVGGGTLYLRTENTLVTNHEPFMIFGFQRLNWAIPPTGCLLQTEMLVAVLVPGSGSPVSLDVPVPAGLSGARFNVQCIRASQVPGGGTVSWWTTNGVDVTLP